MKRILTLGLAFSMSASQAFSYSVETVKNLESATASAKTAAVIISAIIPNTEKSAKSIDALNWIGDLSGQINALASSALQDESCILRITRIIENLIEKTPVHSNGQLVEIDGAFTKNFAFELSHGISAEVMRFFAHKGIGMGMNVLTENRIANRAAHVLGEAISSAVLETAFAKLGDYVISQEASGETNCLKVFSTVFLGSLGRGTAYNIAGEMILQGTTDAHVNYAQAVKEAFSSKK